MPRRQPRASRPRRSTALPTAQVDLVARISRADIFLAGALVLSLLVVYWPSILGTMLWDDAAHITRADLRTMGGLWRIWFDLGATQQYYPLLHSAFWIEHRLWGDSVLGYHLTNVLLHFASALCLVAITRRLGIRGGWLAAWVFALHPVQVESVAWMTEQKNTLSTAFALIAAIVYLRFETTRRAHTYLIATLLFICALLSKSTAATLPAALLVIAWWKRGRLEWHDARPLLPWLVLGLVSGVFTAWVEHTYIGATGEAFTLTWAARVLLAGRIVCFYVATLLWPSHLTFNYPRWNVDTGVWWQYLFTLAVAASVALAWLWRHRDRGPLAASLLFIGLLVPALGFVNVYPFIYSYVADHFQYQASIAFIVAVAAWVTGVAAQRPMPALVAQAAAIAALATVTFQQSATYANVETLYRTTIARNPSSWMAYDNLGVLLAQAPGRLPDAIEAFRNSVRVAPNRADGRRNLAIALSQTGDWAGTVEHYRALLAIDPRDPQDHLNMARALMAIEDDSPRALAEVRAALALNPALSYAHELMGRLLVPTNRAGAIEELRTAIRLKADAADAHLHLGNVLAMDPASLDEAIAEYRTALALRPGSFDAAYNVGTLLLGIPGETPAAIAALTTAVSVRPDDPRAHTNLAVALVDAGRTREAMAHLEMAVRLAPDLPAPRALLARLQGR